MEPPQMKALLENKGEAMAVGRDTAEISGETQAWTAGAAAQAPELKPVLGEG